MSNLNKLRLTLPDGTVFEAEGNLDVTHSRETQFVVNGAQQALALFEEIAPNLVDTGNGSQQTVVLGAGAGVHTIRVAVSVSEGEATQWGSTNADDDVLVKAQELDHALGQVAIDSSGAAGGGPAKLEIGEYSDGGDHGPLDVAVQNADVRANIREQVSTVDVDIEFLDIANLSDLLHGNSRTRG